MDLAQTMLSAAAPMLLQQTQHEQSVEHSAALTEIQLEKASKLHREAIDNAREHHYEALDEADRLGWELLAEEIAVSRKLHQEQLDLAKRHHTEDRARTIDHFDRAIAHAEELHKQGLGFALRTHTHQIQVAHESARRENVRDVWIQKGRKVDTMLITTTLMFSACVAVLCEGNLPHPSVEGFENEYPTETVIVLWAACAATSFSALLVCIFLILAIQARMSEFNLYDINQRYMCYRHGPTCPCDDCTSAATDGDGAGDAGAGATADGQERTVSGASTSSSRSGAPLFRRLTRWQRFIQSYERIPQTHRTFEDYYACHCGGLMKMSEIFFNVGTVTLVVHAAMSLSERLFYIFESPLATYIYVGIFTVAVVSVQMFHMSITTKTRMGHDQLDKNTKRDVDEFYDREKRIYEPLATVHTTKVPRAGKPVVMAKIETEGRGSPFLFLTIDERTLTATDGDLDSECWVMFREWDDTMKGVGGSRWRSKSFNAARRSKVGGAVAAKSAAIPILSEKLYPDPWSPDHRPKLFKVWYQIQDISTYYALRGGGDGLDADVDDGLPVPKLRRQQQHHRHHGAAGTPPSSRKQGRARSSSVRDAKVEYKYFIDLTKPLLKLRGHHDEIALDEDAATRNDPWRQAEPRRGWAICRVKYSDSLLKKRTRQYQAMALKLARVDAGYDTRSVASGAYSSRYGGGPGGHHHADGDAGSSGGSAPGGGGGDDLQSSGRRAGLHVHYASPVGGSGSDDDDDDDSSASDNEGTFQAFEPEIDRRQSIATARHEVGGLRHRRSPAWQQQKHCGYHEHDRDRLRDADSPGNAFYSDANDDSEAGDERRGGEGFARLSGAGIQVSV